MVDISHLMGFFSTTNAFNQETESAVGDLMKSLAKDMFNLDLGDDVKRHKILVPLHQLLALRLAVGLWILIPAAWVRIPEGQPIMYQAPALRYWVLIINKRL